ncbi:MAG: prephenate dehydrogenase/arogenate dehydrogenase family protein [Chloroflexi bacterium]|nr:prephenate dehydrogenase/arogenate dehydrogenase family protein [Chloroflexota bacterium]
MPKSRVTVVGLGLIGGSLGLALKKSNLEVEIIGHDKDSNAASRALKRGAVDKTEWNLINACDQAGLIILALPLDGVRDTLAALKPYLEPGVIVTDTATTKAPVMEWARQLPEGVHFVGGDPIINPRREGAKQGIDAATADLFQGGTYCLTPSTTAAAPAIETMTNFVTLVGARPYFLDAAEHDGLMAGVEHLPAVLATALASATMTSQGWRELGKVAGANFRTATGIAPQDAKTAEAEFLAHRTDLIRWIDSVIATLRELRGALEREDADALQALIEQLADERAKWLSGSLTSEGQPVDWEAARYSTAQLFLGGLATRRAKKSS